MCGILGLSLKSGQIDKEIFLDALNQIHHRGPDATGSYLNLSKEIGFGFKRLSIIDLSDDANQPFVSQCAGYVLVFNGEIYNFQTLKKQLLAKDYTFKTNSDSEVLLNAYIEWGNQCLSRIKGMFAFAIYDLTKKEIFLARDFAGEKPLFYSEYNGSFYFSSELKPIIHLNNKLKNLNKIQVTNFFKTGYVSGNTSIFLNIKKLPPAHSLTFNIETRMIKINNYWKVNKRFIEGGASSKIKNTAYYVDKFENLLDKSIRGQLIADVPVGILLSGGLDSSLITAIASKHQKKLKTFTVTFPGEPKFNEKKHANLIADHFNTEHFELSADSIKPEIVNELTQYYDEPLGDPSMIPTYLISKLVKRHCKVVLGGDGADELFLGYPSFEKKIFQERYFQYIPLSARLMLSRMLLKINGSSARGKSFFYGIGLDFKTLGSSFDPILLFQELHSLLGTNQVPSSHSHANRNLGNEFVENKDFLTRISVGDFKNFLPENILTKIDRATMANSIEGRSPFLDKDILDFSLNDLPNSLKINNGNKKYLLKLLGRKLLPKSFAFDRKQGFSFPIDKHFLNEEWQGYFCQKLESSQIGLINKNYAMRFLISHKKNPIHGRILYMILFFLCWMERYSPNIE